MCLSFCAVGFVGQVLLSSVCGVTRRIGGCCFVVRFLTSGKALKLSPSDGAATLNFPSIPNTIRDFQFFWSPVDCYTDTHLCCLSVYMHDTLSSEFNKQHNQARCVPFNMESCYFDWFWNITVVGCSNILLQQKLSPFLWCDEIKCPPALICIHCCSEACDQCNFFKKLILLVNKECIKLIKSDSKDIYNVTEDFFLKQMLFFWTFYSSKNPEK